MTNPNRPDGSFENQTPVLDGPQEEAQINYLQLMEQIQPGRMRGDLRLVSAREGSEGPQDGQYGPNDHLGRARFVQTPGGDRVGFIYNSDQSGTADGYVRSTRDQSGNFVDIERGSFDATSGKWTIERKVDGQWQKQEALSNSIEKVFGNTGTGVVSIVYKDQGGNRMVHEAHPTGVVVKRMESDVPFQMEREGRVMNMHPARTVITPDGVRSDYSYSKQKDAEGNDVSVLDSRTLTDREGNIIEYSMKNAQGSYDIFRPKPGEKGLDPAKLNDPAKLAEYEVNLTGSDNPLDQVVNIHPDHVTGRRRNILGNGDLVEKLTDGTIVRVHGDRRSTTYTIGSDGKPDLKTFQSSVTGEQWSFEDTGGNLTRVELRSQGSDVPQALVLKDGKWVDERTGKPPVGSNGKPEHFKIERTADGVQMSRLDESGKELSRRVFTADGAEIMSLLNKKGELTPMRVIASSGAITEVNNDTDPPSLIAYFPGSRQPLVFAKVGNAYQENQGIVQPEQGTPSLGADGNITWTRPDGKKEVWDRRTYPKFKQVVRQPGQRAA